MKVEILIIASFQENYGFYEGNDGPWKNKGNCHFSVEVENFWLMYSEDEEIEETFQSILDNQSNELTRYSYESHEIMWHGIQKIEGVIQ